MTTPIVNDLFALIYKAFKQLYPDKEPKCQILPEIKDETDNSECFGETVFDEDGSVYINISGELKIVDAGEVFAHELAHVAVGEEHGHDVMWEQAFDAILQRYTDNGLNKRNEGMMN